VSSSIRLLQFSFKGEIEYVPKANAGLQLDDPSSNQQSTGSLPQSARLAPHLENPPPDKMSMSLLLSFPNSGTSYTLKNTAVSTGRIVATNYASDAKSRSPLFKDRPNGPFIVTFNSTAVAWTRVVLTKTHCGMWVDFERFERSCRTTRGRAVVRSVSASVEQDANDSAYPIELVRSAVHLIRSPLDNLVARMHQGIKKHRRADPNGTLSVLGGITNDRAGFRAWCRFLDAKYGMRLRPLLTNESQALLPSIPCHSDLLHYVGWHNFAVAFADFHHLPHHVIYYEDYGTNFTAATAGLFDFLGMATEADRYSAQFHPGRSYRDYFDPDERRAVAALLSQTASPALWQRLRRYFPPADPEFRFLINESLVSFPRPSSPLTQIEEVPPAALGLPTFFASATS
jgi:hypothetical protein